MKECTFFLLADQHVKEYFYKFMDPAYIRFSFKKSENNKNKSEFTNIAHKDR